MGGWDQNESYRDWLGGVKWTKLAQNRDGWRALVNTVMKLSGSGATELVFFY
jgi:hypothetical protein